MSLKNIARAIVRVAKAIEGDMNIPAKPEVTYLTDNQDGGLTLYWKSAHEMDGVVEYQVYKDREYLDTVGGPLPLENKYVDLDVSADVTYGYYIIAVNDDGDESVPSDIYEGQLWDMG